MPPLAASQPSPPAPPPPPPIPGASIIVAPGAPIAVEGGSGDPAATLRALREQRRELRSQLQTLESKRGELRRELQSTSDGDLRSGLLARLREIDGRILATDQQLAFADVAVSRAAGIPGANVPPPVPRRDGPPESAIIMGGFVMLAAVIPISIAFARRIWRRSAPPPALPPEVAHHLDAIAQAVDSMGLEVERIGEGQRFMTRVMADQRERIPIGEGK